MSTEAVNQFLIKVSEDKELQAEVTTAMEAENDRQAVTELAAKNGYDFTPDELALEITNRQSEFQQLQNHELSENELETIAGGSPTKKRKGALQFFTGTLMGAGITAAIEKTQGKNKW